jgi:hypothetical protein
MTVSTGFFTIASKNYLASVRVLMESLQRFHPGAPRYLVLCDRVEGCFDPANESFSVIMVEDLRIPRFKRFVFQYSILEFNTAVKATAFRYLFDSLSVDRLVYLDPDILLYRPLERVLSELETANVLLTPHRTTVSNIERGTWAGQNLLRGGVYNLGFLGLRRSDETTRLLQWWEECLSMGCRARPDLGLFVDQKWMDLVPALFDGVRILRDSGHNVAYWNLDQRTLTGTATTGYCSQKEPLCFFHFSGYSPLHPESLMSYRGQFVLPPIEGTLAELLEDYRQRLLAQGYSASRQWPYAYANLNDRTPIKKKWREAVLRQVPELADIEDPFDVQATSRRASRLDAAARNLLPQGIEEQWHLNYCRLASAFPVNILLWIRRRALGLKEPDE